MLICIHCSTEITKRKASTYCSNQCQRDKDWSDHKARMGPDDIWTPRRLKRFLLEELGHQCQKCENTEWMGQPIPLELEHIDGNSENTTRNNCTLLCCNCHAQTPTFKNKNKGNGRASRRQRYAEGKSY